MNRNLALPLAVTLLFILSNGRRPAVGDDPTRKRPAAETASADWIYPRISNHGKVIRLPGAADQPREDSRICVDITAGAEPQKMNPAFEKVARFVNLYAGAGARPANVRITCVLHGEATLAGLSHQAYKARFETDNPNLEIIEALSQAGVEILVCGQALAHKDASPGEVDSRVELAVSALTVNVNRQMDGYAYIPLH